MKIKARVEQVPGGMMMVPLLCGAILISLAPRAGLFFGSFTNALFLGALPILAVFYVCMGSTIPFRSLPMIIRRGGALLATKILLGIVAGTVLGHYWGTQPVASGWFAGLSTLAVIAAINDTNGGLYMALMRKFGNAEEAATYSIMALESGPFLTMVTLGVAGLSVFPWQTMLGAILPLFVGMLLGNLDSEMRVFLGQGVPVMIPFFSFAIGTTLDLHLVWHAGLLGLSLGVAIVLVSSSVLVMTDKFVGGDGTAGIAAASTAGNAAAVPMLVATANSKYAAAAKTGTVLVASCVVVTSLLTPPLTAWWHARVNRRQTARGEGT